MHCAPRMTEDSIWRAGATKEELVEVATIDVARAHLDRQSAELADRRYLITNRACQRERYRLRTRDSRDPDHSRSGIFVYHNCSRCKNGTDLSRCPTPDVPGNCGEPVA